MFFFSLFGGLYVLEKTKIGLEISEIQILGVWWKEIVSNKFLCNILLSPSI